MILPPKRMPVATVPPPAIQTVTLSLISHTNAGKTTLARTLLRRDVGEVMDAPHVTLFNESYTLLEAEGSVLQLWDTPGFGDSARLLKRLKRIDKPLIWFLTQTWDRFTDKPLWGSQQALKKVREEADVVLYLLRADRLIAGDADVEGRVRDDLRHIGGWLEARASRPKFFIVGTHCDLDTEFANLSADKAGDYVDSFRKLPIVTELVARGGGAQQVKVVLGSMKSVADTEALVYQIFMQVAA